jgi:ribosomal protein L10
MTYSGVSAIQEYMATWPYIVVYQHQGMTVPMWQQVRTHLGDHVGCMVVKKSHAARAFQDTSLCGGPMCCIGVTSMSDIPHVEQTLKKFGDRLFLLGGYWDRHCWTHQDVVHICSLQSMEQVYATYMSTLSGGSHCISTMSQPSHGIITTLSMPYTQLYTLLQTYCQQHG